MDDDDDFLPSAQFHLTQPSPVHHTSVQRSQPTQSTQRSRKTQQSQPSTSRGAPDLQIELSQIQQGIQLLATRVNQLTGQSGKLPTSSKTVDKKPMVNEDLKCQICSKVLASKVNLFRHYRAIHREMNAERFHGCTVNSTVVDLNTSLNDSGVSAPSVRPEVVCKTCNGNFLFKDFDQHVKNNHPEIYGKVEAKGDAAKEQVEKAKVDEAKEQAEKTKNKVEEAKEKVIVEKTLRSKAGKILHVFKCTKCNVHFDDKFKARRHARVHNKGLKARANVNGRKCRVANQNDNPQDLHTDNHIIFICEACDIATPSYDVVVEHSQNHILNPNAEFVSKLCEICDLKFEPICYERHTDLHYKDKDLHKESFTYLKYKYQLLLSRDWFDCFNMADDRVKKIVSQSIYVHTRSIRMRIISVTGTNSLIFNIYQCCQCDNFVDSTSVTSHALYYDTCVKIKSSFRCNVCNRSFNSKIAREKHIKVHDGDECFRIVIFNNERDREFNKVLNATETGLRIRANAISANTNAHNDKVIYRCLCNLCFVFKDSADDHIKKCPGNDVKQRCLKCDNLFNLVDLQTHCFEHHLNENTKFVIKDIIPNVIEIDSDDEPTNEQNLNDVIVIDSSDDEDNVNIKSENVLDSASNNNLNGALIDVLGSDAEMDEQNDKVVETAQTNNSIRQVASSIDVENDAASGYTPDEINENDLVCCDEDSQNTVIENDSIETVVRVADTESVNQIRNTNPIVCVPTSVLLDPYNIGIGIFNRMLETRNQMATDIEILKRQMERNAEANRNANNIPEVNSSLIDPTDFSTISRRPSLRQIDMPILPMITSTNDQVDADVDLITDDDEADVNSDKDQECTEDECKENQHILADTKHNIKKEVDYDTKMKNKLIHKERNVAGCENVSIVNVKIERNYNPEESNGNGVNNTLVPFRRVNDFREDVVTIDRVRRLNENVINPNPNNCILC